jgi:PAS domain S-box-containing protein
VICPDVVSILLLEGQPSSCRSIQPVLREAVNPAACRIECFESLREGLERLEAARFDVLLLDLTLSGIQGLATLIEVHSGELPIVALISQADEAVGEQAVEAGAADYLVREALSPGMFRRSLRYVIGRAKAAEALHQSELRLRELFDNSHEIFFTLDFDGNITSLNKSGEMILGHEQEEARRMNLKNLVAPEYSACLSGLLERLRAGLPAPVSEVTLVHPDGRRIAMEISSVHPYRRGEEAGIQGIARDMTERRELENLLRQSQKLEAIGRLSGGLAHDFNNLLCAITGHSELMAERLEPGHPASNNLLQVKKAADSAAALIRQLLAFSRQQVFYPQVVNMNTIVEGVEKLFGRLIGEHIEFTTSLDPALGHVRVDPHQLEQALVNLLINARDAMTDGGTLTVATCEANLEGSFHSRHGIVPPGRYVVLCVADTGMGMDAETQSRLFEPFFTTKALGKGTGLGLATVYGIVKQSGGFIWVYSEIGHGTTFKIYIPREEHAPTPSVASKTPSTSFRGSETVLLVEDAEPLRTLTKEFLTDSGYTVLEAANGKEALQIARRASSRIHLLLTDLVMPGIGGRQLADQLTALDPTMAVLYMSGYSNERVVLSGALAEGVVLLEKPFSRESLLRRVRQLLDESQVSA